jgi:hypothetical protein
VGIIHAWPKFSSPEDCKQADLELTEGERCIQMIQLGNDTVAVATEVEWEDEGQKTKRSRIFLIKLTVSKGTYND